jgi:hypothetical protein
VATLYSMLGISPALTLSDHIGLPICLLDEYRENEELL